MYHIISDDRLFLNNFINYHSHKLLFILFTSTIAKINIKTTNEFG